MKNNFDFLRLLFALFVVIAHSYPLSGSTVSENWLSNVTSNQIELSNFALSGFFIISGYLIFQSLERSKTFLIYFWKRFLRLFPALFIVLLLTVILSPFVYENSIPYLQNRNVYWYVPRNLSLYNLKYNINGVFENNPYPDAINGSLWTICYEFTLYIVMAFAFFIKKTKIRTFLVFALFFLMFLAEISVPHFGESIGFYGLSMYYFLKLGTFFVAGSFLASIKIEKLKHKSLILSFSAFLILICIYFNVYNNLKYLLLPLFVILLGLHSTKPLNKISNIGDFSYGIYIYSFPIQQTLMFFLKLNTFSLMLWSVLISILFGYLSWHIIEKKALLYKDIFSNYTFKIIS